MKPLKSILSSNTEKVKKNPINTSVECRVDYYKITCTLRKNIAEWISSPKTDIRLRKLKENKDYEIQVKLSESGGYTAAIMCQM